MLGPFAGAFLNYCFGYAVPLFIFSAAVISCCVGAYIIIPHDRDLLNQTNEKEKLPLLQSLKHKEVIEKKLIKKDYINISNSNC